MAGIYIHVPFCVSKCHYCDFFKTTNTEMLNGYLDALMEEFLHRKNSFDEKISTLYFGGGTPSLIPLPNYDAIFSRLKKLYQFIPDAEITIEANPDDLSSDYLMGLREIGFNRISIGIQSFHDDDLKRMGRRHTGQQAMQSVMAASDAGFNNISLDLIYGLSWSGTDKFVENLKMLKDLPFQHLSAYHLTIEQGTNFYKQQRKGKLREMDEDESLKQYLLLCEFAQNLGMEHYEVSNFCLPGYISRHNSSYWDGTPYIGFGPGSHSFYGSSRYWNQSDLLSYIGKKFDLVREQELLTSVNKFNELIMLGLRTKRGIDMSLVTTYFQNHFNAIMQKWVDNKFLYQEGSFLKCSEKGWFIVDAIIEDFFVDADL
ncbi:radical SAM family heme chaperone HemW [Natronoflexus pectinivorans]|uniref:Heme chaperone HemW n=1 Tax=Natronoflexus pectinivorans TaxID=682526 RepID=A0A4R2GNR5_9BACT|nr:radical SAM family heme chaperone HemW [Natronoflexus pectinivorans]TCO10955.1 oxygen-independent coproporphyrinogen-3 oxidase [Natronoflexus pectinivorans]